MVVVEYVLPKPPGNTKGEGAQLPSLARPVTSHACSERDVDAFAATLRSESST